jgi:hypothetical protein
MIGKDWVDYSPSDFIFPNRYLGNLALPPGRARCLNGACVSITGSYKRRRADPMFLQIHGSEMARLFCSEKELLSLFKDDLPDSNWL